MKAEHIGHTPFPLAVLSGVFNPNEISWLKAEMGFLSSKLQTEEHTGSATNDNGELLKKTMGVFVDDVYYNRDSSRILNINRKIFNEVIPYLASRSSGWFFDNIQLTKDHTLVAYYEEEDYYKAHSDTSLVTVITWLYEEPKRFKGGDLIFPDHDLTVSVENNTTVIFPGCIPHQVSEVSMLDSKDKGKGLGRNAMIQFGNIT